MSGLSRQAEEDYLGRVATAIDSHLRAASAQLPEVWKEAGRIPDRDYSAQVHAHWRLGSTETRLHTLRELRSSPYFGRIDYVEDGDADRQTIYLGPVHLDDPRDGDYLVYDWRAPVGTLYYQGELGPSSYFAPAGQIQVRIERKRTYEIKRCKLIRISETARGEDNRNEAPLAPLDDMLQELLDRNTSGSMRQIVQTIQAEQDTVIRSEAEVLVVQGPAGSGKTVVALHRAAYLLYQLREKRGLQAAHGITAQRMLVLSPNQVFSDYISRVLPDLKEGQIRQVILERLVRERLARGFAKRCVNGQAVTSSRVFLRLPSW